jgi:hypothetical protein
MGQDLSGEYSATPSERARPINAQFRREFCWENCLARAVLGERHRRGFGEVSSATLVPTLPGRHRKRARLQHHEQLTGSDRALRRRSRRHPPRRRQRADARRDIDRRFFCPRLGTNWEPSRNRTSERSQKLLPTRRSLSTPLLSTSASIGGVVGRPKAAMEVVVDHTDVLHERVHARRPHEAIPLRLQLLRELPRLRRRRG